MIKIAICDDIREFRDDIERKLEIWSAEKGINISVRKFDDGVPLLHCLNDNGMFDMIFLDIEMEKLNGMETATRIRKADYITAIVFISQYEDYYKDAYNVHPFHFLSKPIKQNKIDEVMDTYIEIRKQNPETFSFTINKSMYAVWLSEILYFNSERRKVNIICKDKQFTVYGKLSEIEKELGEKDCKFLRIHQSFLVNMRYIREYHYSELIMSNGETLLISKENRKKMREIHMLLLEQQ
ncbi:MAG: response regulator transcription factor [Lachnospiraceae bacterium]|nr:response regulator transcription factor [Lachnospiraceae bacterium]